MARRGPGNSSGKGGKTGEGERKKSAKLFCFAGRIPFYTSKFDKVLKEKPQDILQ